MSSGITVAEAFMIGEIASVEWKQWEGRVIDGKLHLNQYVGGSAHSAVFAIESGSKAPRQAVVKLVPADLGRVQTWVLRRELAARLSHPGLLSVFQFGACQVDETSLAYAVIERAEEDLSQVIPIRSLEPEELRQVLDSLLGTLGYLHAEGFVHGCLTPANIMAIGDQIKVSSDGLLRIGESSDDLWEPRACAPPESRTGISPAGDVWSLGMLVVEALTQRLPEWDADRAADPAIPEGLPAPFRDIARRCLRIDPRLRFSLAEIALALHPPSAAPQPRPAIVEVAPIAKPAEPPEPWRSRYFLPTAAACVVVGVLIFAGALLTRGSSPAQSSQAAPAAAAPTEPTAIETKPTPFQSAPARENPAPLTAAQTAPAPAPAAQPAVLAPAANNSATTPSEPDVVERVLPQVPSEILATVRGLLTVRVRVHVDSSGAVAGAELASPVGSKYFDRVTLEAARHWQFKPATDAGGGAERVRVLRFECRAAGCQAF